MGEDSILVLCDFDGTASTVDVGKELLDRFTGDGWEQIDRDYCDSKIGSRIAYMKIAPLFRGSRAPMLDFVLERGVLDPHFKAFYGYCRRRGMDLKILSDGLGFYIEAILRRYGMPEIEFFSNTVVFREDGRLSIEFPPASPDCGRCGNCKAGIVERFRPFYDRIIYIGDSYSDVCPAKNADLVFAKNILYEKCSQNGTPCIQYESFDDILKCLERERTVRNPAEMNRTKPAC